MNDLKSKVLYYLAKRDYSYKELLQKLQKHSQNIKEITNLLDECVQKGWLCEERYIINYIQSKSKKYSLLKIKNELQQKTNNTQLIEEILAKSQIDEYQIALSIWQKKFKVIAVDAKDRAKQARFLQSRGFSLSTIKKILNNTDNEYE
ncbi:MAG TPA: regulatory protein RecX [Burkholderiales bacterium]|nr:regulatory protein RecX [Burkholderiales bacterium]